MKLPMSSEEASSSSSSNRQSRNFINRRLGMLANVSSSGGNNVLSNTDLDIPLPGRFMQRRSVSLNELSSTASAAAAAAASFQNQDWTMQDSVESKQKPTSNHKRTMPQEISSMAQAKRMLTDPLPDNPKRPAVRRTGSMDLVSLNNSNRTFHNLPTTFLSRSASVGSSAVSPSNSRKNSLLTSSGATITNTLLPAGAVATNIARTTPGGAAGAGRFTEAIPLTVPATFCSSKSIYSGIHNATQQAIQTMTLYIQKCYPHHSLSTRDISIGPDAWKLVPQHGTTVAQIPKSLRRLGINFLYQREAILVFNPGGGGEQVTDVGLLSSNNWYENGRILGRFLLKYGCAKMIHGCGGAVAARAAAENFLQQQQQQQYLQQQHSEDVERSLVLYEYNVEYRTPQPTSASIPATNNTATSREMQLLLNGKTKQKSAGTWRKMESEMEELALLQFSPSTVSLDGSSSFDVNQQHIDLSLIQQAALSSLRNSRGKFICEFLSSQTSKRYRFDFMDGSISTGYVPRYESYPKLPQQEQGVLARSDSGDEEYDPTRESKKVLCVTINEGPMHPSPSSSQRDLMAQDPLESIPDVSKITLTLDGPLKNPLSPSFFTAGDRSSSSSSLGAGGGGSGGSYQGFLSSHFRILRAAPTSAYSPSAPMQIATSAGGQILLLHPCERGRVYIDGIYVTTWNEDGSGKGAQKDDDHSLPLFGFDLKGVSILRGAAAGAAPKNSEEKEQFEEEGRIVNKEELKWAYSRLLQEVLIDASQLHKNVARRLYHRLNVNEDISEEVKEEFEQDVRMKVEDAEDEVMGGRNTAKGKSKTNGGISQKQMQQQQQLRTCLESEIMSDSRYDPVGIAARALSTHFSKTYGKDAYPCVESDVHEVKKRLVGRKPIVVSKRLLPVLKRGAYFGIGKMEEYEWFSAVSGGSRVKCEDVIEKEAEGGTKKAIVQEAIRLLCEAGCPAEDVTVEKIVLLTRESNHPLSTLNGQMPSHRSMCRYNKTEEKFYVNDLAFKMPLSTMKGMASGVGGEGGETDGAAADNEKDEVTTRAFLLGFFIAQEHEDGSLLLRYILKHGAKSG